MPTALVSLAAVIAGLGALALPASAGTVGAAEAEVAALQARALSEAVQVHAWTARYEADVAAASYLHTERVAERAALRSLVAHMAGTRALLQQEAVLAYAGALSNASAVVPSADELANQIDRAGYEDVAVGDISDTLSQFQSEQAARTTELATYDQELHRDMAALASAASARQRALGRAVALQALITEAQARAATLAAAASRARTGSPVGNGVVKAVTEQLAGSTASPVPAAVPTTVPSAVPTTVTTTDPPAAHVHARARIVTSSVTKTITAGAALRRFAAVLKLGTGPAHTPGKLATSAPGSSTATTTTGPAPSTTVTTARVPATTVPTTTVPTTTVPTTTVPTTTVPATTSTTGDSLPSTTADPPTTQAATTTTTAAATGGASAGAQRAPASGVWLELRECESGDNYQENTGNGYYGAYQFSWATWNSLGYPGRPDLEPYWVQDDAAEQLQAEYGWGQWPACSAALGL